MKTANVAKLKENLSAYLHDVEQGDEVLVTSHRRPVARLVPENSSSGSVRPPSLPLHTLKDLRGVKPGAPLSAVGELMADRRWR